MATNNQLFVFNEDGHELELAQSGDTFTITTDGDVQEYSRNDLYFYQINDLVPGGRLLGQYINRNFPAPETIGEASDDADNQEEGALTSENADDVSV